jgi:hypothetical protein
MGRRRKPMAAAVADDKKPVNRTGVSLHVYIEPALREALDRLVDREERGLTAEVSRALRVYLAQQGLWPPEKD